MCLLSRLKSDHDSISSLKNIADEKVKDFTNQLNAKEASRKEHKDDLAAKDA